MPFLDLVHGGASFRRLQMLIASTFQVIRTRDRRCRMPLSLEAVRAWRVESSLLWGRYAQQRAELDMVAQLRGQPLHGFVPPVITHDLLPPEMKAGLEDRVNEVYLFHGTSPAGALGIVRGGFDISRATGAACYGPGLYFSECSSKGDEYCTPETAGVFSGHCAMLLCRVSLGDVLQWPHREFSPELRAAWARCGSHSILGDRQKLRGTYREFVLPEASAAAAYPEYIVVYKRRYDDDDGG